MQMKYHHYNNLHILPFDSIIPFWRRYLKNTQTEFLIWSSDQNVCHFLLIVTTNIYAKSLTGILNTAFLIGAGILPTLIHGLCTSSGNNNIPLLSSNTQESSSFP